MSRLLEQACRKPAWQPGAEVVLADGQVWHFPRPTLVYRLTLNPITRAPAFLVDAHGQSPTYGELLDKLDTCRQGSGPYFFNLTALALELLSQQYTIPDDAVPELFVYDPASQISKHRWQAIHQAVLGLAGYPKPRAVGCA